MPRTVTSRLGNVLSDVPDSIADNDPRLAERLAKMDRMTEIRNKHARENEAMGKVEVGEGLTGFREGIGAGLSRVGRSVGELGGRLVRNEAEQEAERERIANISELERPLLETGRGAAGAFVGETAATLPIGGLVTGGVARLGGQAAARGLGTAINKALPAATKIAASPYGRGIVEGAAVGALTANPDDRVSGALGGGAFGGLATGAGMMLRRSLAGSRASRAALGLEKQGIELTPGQRVRRLPGGQAGTLATIEQAATNIPIAGSLISAPRETAETQFTKLFASKAAPPGVTPKLTGIARTDLERLGHAYDTAYKGVLNYPVYPKVMRTAGGDLPLKTVFDDATRAGIDVKDIVDPKLLKRLANPMRAIDAQDIQQVRSQVRRELGRLRRFDQAQPGNRDILRKVREIEAALTETLETQAPAGKMKALGEVDAAYRNFATFEDAIERAVQQLPKQGGQLTTAQIMKGVVASASERGGKRALAKGEAPMQRLAEQGLEVFKDDVPLTGSVRGWGGAVVGSPLTAFYGAGGSGLLGRGFAPSLRKSALPRALRRWKERELLGRAARLGAQAYNTDED